MFSICHTRQWQNLAEATCATPASTGDKNIVDFQFIQNSFRGCIEWIQEGIQEGAWNALVGYMLDIPDLDYTVHVYMPTWTST